MKYICDMRKKSLTLFITVFIDYGDAYWASEEYRPQLKDIKILNREVTEVVS